MMSKYKRGGWRGNSRGHALAAKGIKMYAKKQLLTDPVFLAAKKEQELSSSHIRDMVMDNLTFAQMKRMHPDIDAEDVRLRAIKAVDMRNGRTVLSLLNRNGVDLSVGMANASRRLKDQMKMTLKNSQARSLLQEPKVQALEKRLNE